MAIPSFVNSGTRSSTGFGTSVNPGYPASCVAGNIAFLIMMNPIATRTPNWPAGFTQIYLDNVHFTFAVAYKILAGGESGTVNVSWTSATSGHAYMVQYTGNVALAACLGQTKQDASGSATSWSYTSIATTSNNSLVIAFCGDGNNNYTSISAPSGWTKDLGASSDFVISAGIASSGNQPTSPFGVSGLSNGSFHKTFQQELRSVIPGLKWSQTAMVG